MTEIRISLDSSRTQAAINGSIGKLSNLKPIFSSVGEYMLRSTRANFDNERAPDGAAWAPLAAASIKAKERRSKSGKTRTGKSRARSNAAPNAILKDTYNLRDTINYKADSISVKVGTPTTYGVVHQYGAPKANVPKRPFLGFSDKDIAEIKEIVIDALTIL